MLALIGDVDRASVRPLSASLAAEASRSDSCCRILDLSRLRFADSTIVGVVFELVEKLPAGCWVGVVGASPGVFRVLTLSGATDFDSIRFFETVEDALAAISEDG